ncbi:hypothetical protein CC80DRAFT_551807 [Byssothecium circinans]|uniref:FAD dependent oxidoreductase domain-containing protein n=1 Tax=Byssothecium circinans TaxID=147558 RepID=A0A6A5TLM9_9PLEO|nr:hypothetical protein CC80DRAFT_551807 [Byssothecium circinans]
MSPSWTVTPDGSSVDISRLCRFDYADPTYLKIAFEAYQKWAQEPKFKDIFEKSAFILASSTAMGQSYIKRTTEALSEVKLPWERLNDATAAKNRFPVASGKLAGNFTGYWDSQAGWADAEKAIHQLRDECIEKGVSFICGRENTVVDFENDPTTGRIRYAHTVTGNKIEGTHFVVAGRAWMLSLVSNYNSTLATGQVLGYMKLTPKETEKYKCLPSYINFSTG